MAAVTVLVADLQALLPSINPALAQRLIDGTLARAARIAPCILDPAFLYPAAAKAIVVDVILRRVEAGSGAVQQEAAGPMSRSFFPQTSTRSLFWPSEITELQGLCYTATAAQPGTTGLPDGVFPDADLPNLYPGTYTT